GSKKFFSDGASTKAISDSVLESLKESIPGTDVAPDAMAYL
ncbi:hypothetical protein A2U01_0062178, partial [Trifolium medium]|nr:hypothetical protein [Trifolium medium]